MTVEEDITVSKLLIASGSVAGTSITLARMGLYTVAPNGDLTLVAATANDTTILASVSTAYAKPLAVAGDLSTALTSYKLKRGQRIAVGLLVVFSGTAPRVTGKSGAAVNMNNASVITARRLNSILTGQADLATSTPDSGLTSQAFTTYAAVLA
jgi:hypothetical protein